MNSWAARGVRTLFLPLADHSAVRGGGRDGQKSLQSPALS